MALTQVPVAQTGGMTLLSTTTFSGATTTLSSIPQSYRSLYLKIQGVTYNTSDQKFRMLPNNINNKSAMSGTIAASPTGTAAGGAETVDFTLTQGAFARAGGVNFFGVNIYDYASTTKFKPIEFYGYWTLTSTTYATNAGGGYFENTPITSLVFDVGGTNTFSGGTIELYGVK